jgi:hypothetical protein
LWLFENNLNKYLAAIYPQAAVAALQGVLARFGSQRVNILR